MNRKTPAQEIKQELYDELGEPETPEDLAAMLELFDLIKAPTVKFIETEKEVLQYTKKFRNLSC